MRGRDVSDKRIGAAREDVSVRMFGDESTDQRRFVRASVLSTGRHRFADLREQHVPRAERKQVRPGAAPPTTKGVVRRTVEVQFEHRIVTRKPGDTKCMIMPGT